FAKWKRMFEFRLPFGIRSKCVAGMHLRRRVEREHLAGVVKGRSCGVFLRARPSRIAERTENRRSFADTDVTRNQIGLFERDVQFCFIGKLKREDFLRSTFCSSSRVGCAFF